MHPHELLNARVNDHRRQLIFDAEAFRRACQGDPARSRPSRTGPTPIGLFPVVRRLVGHRLIQAGRAIGAAEPTAWAAHS